MLELDGISKRFGAVQALRDVSVRVDAGRVVGIVGENGAGKSTLMKVLNGIHRPDAGTIRRDGRPITVTGPRHALSLGIGMVFQEQSLIPNLSVAENVYLGNEARFTRLGRIDWSALRAAARRQLDKVGLAVDPLATVSGLSFMQRQMVEIAKVLTLEDQVEGELCILLDEPTSVLEQAEIDVLFEVVERLKRRAGVIFISHRLDEVIAISDVIYVMKDGEVVAELAPEEATPRDIHRLMVGREGARSYYRQDDRRPAAAEVALSVEGLGRGRAFADIGFALHVGEVLALVGTEGSGVEALIRALFGLERTTSGTIRYFGRAVTGLSPAAAVAAGIGYVPRERRLEGVVEEMTVEENVCLADMRRLSRFGLLDFRAMRAATARLIDRLRIKTPGAATVAAHLSGGNQQKVVLARWHNAGARLFLLDHPTRGLDVGAKEDVYTLIREFCAGGAAVVLIADTLEEALGLAHTVLVMKDGRQTARFDATGPEPVTPLDLIGHMV